MLPAGISKKSFCCRVSMTSCGGGLTLTHIKATQNVRLFAYLSSPSPFCGCILRLKMFLRSVYSSAGFLHWTQHYSRLTTFICVSGSPVPFLPGKIKNTAEIQIQEESFLKPYRLDLKRMKLVPLCYWRKNKGGGKVSWRMSRANIKTWSFVDSKIIWLNNLLRFFS